VGCALDGTMAFNFVWTDASGVAHWEAYPGILGLAPEWGTGPLGEAHQELVSACMAARTNYYGVAVDFSLRGPASPIASPSSAELGAYPSIEGAFWGDLFAATPYLRACNVPADVSNDRAQMRDCAAGHLSGGSVVDCGIIQILGDCASFCTALDGAGQFYPSCTDPSLGTSTNVVTTSLASGAVAGATANLQIQDSAPASLTVGACNKVTHTIKATNTGSTTAAAPVVIVALPEGLVFSSALSATSTGGSCSAAGSIVTCALSDLAAGASTTFVVNAAPTVWGATVSDTAVGATSSPESSVADNIASASTSLVAPTPSSWEPITLSFNGTPIPHGNTIWFNGELKPQGLPSTGITTIWAIGGTITFSAGGVTYSVPVPSSRVTFDPSVSTGSTAYDTVHSQWITRLPTRFSGNAFMAAVPFPVPSDLPGGIGNVVWSTHFVTNQSGVSITPMASAAVYTTFTNDFNAIGVQPVDDSRVSPYDSSDHAGTPELFKAYLTGGACGAGGSNYTGGITQSSPGSPELQASCH
jgi:uncharacterized repeat protein (TIGR01451 family)